MMGLTQSHEATKGLRDESLERLATIAVDCGYHLHAEIGPGLLETVYEALLTAYLEERGLHVARQVVVPIRHRGVVIDQAFRADMIVEGRLLIELKSAEQISPVHSKQVLTYLRLLDMPLGLLMNFGLSTYRDGIRRIANSYYGGIA
jgi:GxxExxY protein